MTVGCRSARSSPGSFNKPCPRGRFDLNVIARAGDTLEMQNKILSTVSRRPDVLIIYSGHNEFYSRLWWARNIDHYLDDKRASRWAVFLERIEKHSPLCVLIRESADRCRIALPPPADTHRELVDVPNFTAIEYTTILTDFRRRLEELVSHAERVGAMPVLILPAANDTGFEPNRSFLPPTTSRNERDRVRARIPGRAKVRRRRPGGRDQALSGADRPPTLLRGDSLPISPSPRRKPARGMKLIRNTSPRATWTACRCVAQAPSRKFIARWRRDTAAS